MWTEVRSRTRAARLWLGMLAALLVACQATPPDATPAPARAISASLTLVGWGSNVGGEIFAPADLGRVTAIAAGGFHSVALNSEGTVVAWGGGMVPHPAGLGGIIAVSVSNHGLALRADGTVLGWGDDSSGQASPPAGLRDVTAVAAGGGHSLALRRDGTVVAWGDDSSGQASPPAGLRDVVAIAAGNAHSLALRADGTVAAWGANDQGQVSAPAAPGATTRTARRAHRRG